VTINIAQYYRGRRVTSAKAIVEGVKVPAARKGKNKGYRSVVDLRGRRRGTAPVGLTLNFGAGRKAKLDRVFHPCPRTPSPKVSQSLRRRLPGPSPVPRG
jgi:hypothetical protein